MPIGRVKWFNDRKNYGFITDGGRHDIMVHYSVIQGDGFRTLNDGELVEFDAEQGPKGMVATRVVRLDAPQRVPSAAARAAAEAATSPLQSLIDAASRPASRRGALRPR